MECIQTQIAERDAFYGLFFREFSPGDSISRIYSFQSFDEPNPRLVAQLDDWIVSIWLSPDGTLFCADFEGEIYTIDDGMSPLTTLDVLGVTFLTGFSSMPDFILGEGGELYYRGTDGWKRIDIGGKEALFSVDQVRTGRYYIAGENGLVIEFNGRDCFRMSMNTNVDIHSVCAIDDRKVIAVGDLGAAFLLDRGSVRDISLDVESFQDAHKFLDRIVVSAERDGVYSLDTDSMTFEKIFDKPSYLISSNNNFCLTHGGGYAHLFNGTNWRSLEFEALIPDIR